MTRSRGVLAGWPSAWVDEAGGATVAMVSVDEVDPAAVAAAISQLSPVERERAATIAGDASRTRFAVGRLLLRSVAGQVLGIEPSALSIEARCPDCGGPHGAPVLVGGPAGVAVSVSYSGPIVAVAVSALGSVGIDVEVSDAHSRDVAAVTVGNAGRAEAEPAIDPLRHWTRVEAVLKADGRGLRLEHSAVSFQSRRAQLVASVPAAHGRARSSFAVMDLDTSAAPYPGIIASLAAASSH